jgi:hypothetical protein|tara:strand:- start:863 stop:1039 length:177 start_codon:yes stop_codon:yes gene_type:complete
MRYLLGIIILTSCTVPMPKKEWSDDYDPEEWRKQYENCKHLINTEFWTNCMGEFNKDE